MRNQFHIGGKINAYDKRSFPFYILGLTIFICFTFFISCSKEGANSDKDYRTPWDKQNNEKDEYLVFQNYLTKTLNQRLRENISDSIFRNFVKVRANNYPLENRNISLQFYEDAFIDLGAYSLNQSNTLIPIKESIGLRKYITQRKLVNMDKEYINSFFWLKMALDVPKSKKSKKLILKYSDFILISATDKDLGYTRLYQLSEDGKTKLLIDEKITQNTISKEQISSYLKKINSWDSSYYGNQMQLLGKESDNWSWYRIKELGKLIKIYENERPTLDYNVEVTKIEKEDGATSQPIEIEREWADIQEENKNIVTIGPTFGGIGVSTTGEQDEGPSGQQLWGPEEGFGSWFCNRECSRSDCRECCDTGFNVEMANIGLIAAACHGSSDACPWCHAGCASAEITLAIAAGVQLSKCRDNCNMEYMDFGSNQPVCPS